MKQIKFIAELQYQHDWPPTLALPATVASQGKIICTMETARPVSSYWTDWGGTYDMPDTSQILLFFDGFLSRVESEADLLNTQKSYYVEGTRVYIHLPRYPWTYSPEHAQTKTVQGYASAPPDGTNPSDDAYMINGVRVHYPVRLRIPSVKNELSDIISGVKLYNTFNFRFANNDGHFDNLQLHRVVGTPARLSKSLSSPTTLGDYKTIRYGYIQDINITTSEMTIEAAEINRTLDDQVCRHFQTREFDERLNLADKRMPIAWGSIKGAKLIKLRDRQYIPCDPDYLEGYSDVYDDKGNIISQTLNDGGNTRSQYEIRDKVIHSTDPQRLPKTCDFTGRSAGDKNKIGRIIVDEIEAKSKIPYTASNWDLTETEEYIAASPQIGLLAEKGKVKDIIVGCLTNDSAFLITKNDGRLTLRGWGLAYPDHEIPSWQITKPPQKSYSDDAFFCSSVRVLYGYRHDSKKYERSILLDQDEEKIYKKWHTRQRREVKTRLIDDPSAEVLANTLLGRFRRRIEVVTVAVGYNTAEINPLDTVSLEMVVNDRRFSSYRRWRVRAVNPAQDILELEAITDK